MFNINPVAFTIFGISVNWYGICIACGVLLAIYLAGQAAKRRGYDPDLLIDCALLAVPLGVLGGRAYYVIFEWEQFGGSLMRILDIRSGGLAIYGAVIGGMIGVWIFSKWRKIPFLRVVDFIMPSLILAQGIGRWGNFFNQEAFGRVVLDPNLQFFPYAVYIQALGEWHQATFFYESVWCIAMFFVLWAYQKRTTKDGNVLALYLVLYGFERMIVEGMRTDSLYLGGIRVSQLLSAILFIAAGLYLLYPLLNKVAGRIDETADRKKTASAGRGKRSAEPVPADGMVSEQAEETVKEIAETVREQAETAEETAEKAEEIAETAENAAEDAEKAAEEVSEAVKSTEGGFEVAQSLLDELEALEKQNQEN